MSINVKMYVEIFLWVISVNYKEDALHFDAAMLVIVQQPTSI